MQVGLASLAGTPTRGARKPGAVAPSLNDPTDNRQTYPNIPACQPN